MSHPDIRIGTLAGRGAKTAEYIRQILPHGFESFQINFHHRLPAEVTLKTLAPEVRRVLDGAKTDAVISSLGVFGNMIEEKEVAQDLESCLDTAHLFGPSCKVVCCFAGCVTGKPLPESIKPWAEVFRPLVKKAEDKGLKIAFENCPMGGNWNRPNWNIAINPAAWELMFNEINSAALGLCWEPAHQMHQLIDPIPQLRKWVAKIVHLHGKDASVNWDVIRADGLSSGKRTSYDRTPGFGDTNWTDVFSILRLGGFKGFLDIEGWHDPVYRGDLEMTGQLHALNYLKRCRGGEFVTNPTV